jgi:hypothetical protein
MAKTLTKTINVALADSGYTGTYGQGAAILQLTQTETVSVSNAVLNVFRGPTVTLAVNSSGIVLFPAIGALPANARITMDFQVEYGAGDVTAVNRLLTWTRDTVVVETNEEFGSFSFDTSLTVARVGTEACYVTPIYTIRA